MLSFDEFLFDIPWYFVCFSGVSYERFLKRAKNENFADISRFRFLYQSGFNKKNLPVVVFIARNYPTSHLTSDKVMLREMIRLYLLACWFLAKF